MSQKKHGFTLVELLAVIVVLGILFSLTILFNSKSIKDATKKIDETTKNMILKATNEYVIEFRKNNDTWKENVNESGEINFCVSLQSLIDKGYYYDTDEYVSKNKDKILVSVKMDKNKVYTFNLIDKNKADEYCIYKQSDSKLNNEQGNIVIKDDNDESNIGSLDYKVDKIDSKYYDVDINFITKLGIDTVEKTVPVYVVIALDNSGSMSTNNKWTNAKDAAISLSNTIINSLDDANIALVQFNEKPILSRSFENKALVTSNFILPSGNTNVSGGLDLSASLYKELNNIPDNSMLYTILLYDGAPMQTSYLLKTNNKKIYNSSSQVYYDNFFSAYNNFNNNYSLQYQNDTSITYIKNASNYLKDTINSKIISIGYGFSGGTSLKEISSLDNDFCANSDYSTTTYKYNEVTMNDIDMLTKDLIYPFKYNESDDSLVSTNVGVGTESYGVYKLDLSNYSSDDEFELEFDYEINYPNGNRYATTLNYLKIVINEAEERGISKFYNYACYDSSDNWYNYSGNEVSMNHCKTNSSTTKVNILGGKIYYIHLYYEQNSGTNGSVKINKISYSLTNTETIYDNKNGYDDKFYLSTEEESRIVFGSKVDNNKLILSAEKEHTTSGAYRELDLTNKDGNYLLTINAQSKNGRGTIYITENSYPPQLPAPSFNSSYYQYIKNNGFNTNKYKRMFGETSATDFSFLVEGGKKYYIHFINDVNSSSNFEDNFTINSMSLVKIGDKLTDDNLLTNISSDECSDNVDNISCLKKSNTYNYYFKYENSSLISTNKEIPNSCSHSYLEINLENYSTNEYYVISFDSLVSSDYNDDFGNIIITDSPDSPTTTSDRYCTLDSNKTCVTISSGSNSASSYTRLQGGKKYYIHFTYCKNGYTNSGNDYFAINKINMYEGTDNIDYVFKKEDVVDYKNYTFNEQENRSLISTNVGIFNTKAYRYIKIDLSDYSSSDRFLLETDNYVSSNNNSSLYLTLKPTFPIGYSSIWYSNYSTTATYEKIITGGKTYYLHFVYTKSTNSNSKNYEDIYRIDGVRVKKYINDSINKIDFNKENEVNNYYFVKDNNYYVSQINDKHSAAYSYFKLDLKDYLSSQTINLTLNATLSSNTSDNYIYVTTNQEIPIFSYNCNYALCKRISKSTQDYTISLTGGKIYYVHLLNTSGSTKNTMTINSIKLEEKLLDKTDYYCYYNANVDNINNVFANLSNSVTEEVPKLAAKKAEIVLTTNVDNDNIAFHILDNNGNQVDKIVKEIDLTSEDIDLEEYTIDLSDNYRFILDDEVKCPEKKDSCQITKRLFNIKLILYYEDNETKEVSLKEELAPTVTINIEGGQAIN